MENRISDIERYGLKAKGRTELVRHLQGRQISRGQAILAKCYDCMGYYADGKCDCSIPSCPLYGYMVYRGGTDG